MDLVICATSVQHKSESLHLYCLFFLFCRFTNAEDKNWFEAAIGKVAKANLDESLAADMLAEPFFVDFMQDAPEPTGEEPEDADMDAPKIYNVCFWPTRYQKLNNQRISNKLHVYLHLCNNYSAYVSQVTTCFFSD